MPASVFVPTTSPAGFKSSIEIGAARIGFCLVRILDLDHDRADAVDLVHEDTEDLRGQLPALELELLGLRDSATSLVCCSDLVERGVEPVGPGTERENEQQRRGPRRESSVSPEDARDEVLGLLLGRPAEDLLGRPLLDDVAHEQEGDPVGDAPGLGEVVRDDDERQLRAELEDQLLDPGRRVRVERRARLVHQHHVGSDREHARDAEALLLAAGEAKRRTVEIVLDLVPETRTGSAFSTGSASALRRGSQEPWSRSA